MALMIATGLLTRSLVLAASLALGACAGARDDAATPTEPQTDGGVTLSATAVTISSPANGEVATVTGGGRHQVLHVAGMAPASTDVRLTLGCTGRPCVSTPTAGGDGAWTADVPLRLDPAQRVLSVSAEPAAADNADPATVVLVRLDPATTTTEAPRAPARAKPRRRRVPAEPVAPDQLPPAVAPSGAQPPSSAPVNLIGDSLAQGIAPLLPAALGVRQIATDAKRSRPLSEGMRIVRRARPGTRLAISLFTNDDPRSVAALDRAVRDSVRVAGTGGCAVWATIVRPPVAGVSYAAANDRLRRLVSDRGLDGRLRLVEWDLAVAANPSWLAGDGVHATQAGYRGRAALYAQALASC